MAARPRVDDARAFAGRYELRELIGSGGMAAVWLAEDTRLRREVAVKLLSEATADDPDYLARFRREARVAASLAHPNVVSVYDFDADSEPPYLVMEHVPGRNLAQRLADREGVDIEGLARDLLAALAAIHRAEFVHRDVKPQNVLIDPEGNARLADFGIARPQDATSITQTGQMPGTARYMAPELMEGEPATPRSDLFSCGVVLFEAMSAGPAPRSVERLIELLTESDPSRRPESAREALGALGAPGSGEAAPAVADAGPETDRLVSPVGPPPERPITVGRRQLAAIAGLAAAALLIVLVIALAGGGEDRQPQEAARADRAQTSGGRDRDEGGDRSPPPADESATQVDPARGFELNEKGRQLIDAGDHEAAVPILERAVASYPQGTDDINYAFALFNYGQALRLAGQPEEAIPILEERLEIPNQTEVVEAELAAARADAE